MAQKSFKYVVIGGGLAGYSAASGIRELDPNGSLLMAGSESRMPYDRPPLTKDLWFGTKQVPQIFLNQPEFYERNRIELMTSARADSIDPDSKQVHMGGSIIGFEKLLIATGGIPRTLPLPGSDLEGVCYYRTLDDYEAIRGKAAQGRSAVIIGGGFIGSELAAGLNLNGVEVTVIFPGPHLVDRVLPGKLGEFITGVYRDRGVRVMTGERPAGFERKGERFITRTQSGAAVESDMLIIGVGISPETTLARSARLATDNGIIVNAYLQTSHPDIYAAGDNAFFPYDVLGKGMRVEHWDNALNQGRYAGRNMAGAMDAYNYMPYFFSDLFPEFGYEAVGEIDSTLETRAVWEKENEKGVIYYLAGPKIRGVMNCNIWGQIEGARELIRSAATVDSLGSGRPA